MMRFTKGVGTEPVFYKPNIIVKTHSFRDLWHSGLYSAHTMGWTICENSNFNYVINGKLNDGMN